MNKGKTLTAVAACLISGAALAANPNKTFDLNDRPQANPFGLVYRGAITRNMEGRVNIHPVTYKLHGLTISANVYTPAGYDPKKTYPAITVAHPNGGVKEQVAGLTRSALPNLAISPLPQTPPIRDTAKASLAIPTNPSSARKISTAWPIICPSIPELIPTALAPLESAAEAAIPSTQQNPARGSRPSPRCPCSIPARFAATAS